MGSSKWSFVDVGVFLVPSSFSWLMLGADWLGLVLWGQTGRVSDSGQLLFLAGVCLERFFVVEVVFI